MPRRINFVLVDIVVLHNIYIHFLYEHQTLVVLSWIIMAAAVALSSFEFETPVIEDDPHRSHRSPHRGQWKKCWVKNTGALDLKGEQLLPNSAPHSAWWPLYMSHQVWSAIQSTDLWAEKFEMLGFNGRVCRWQSRTTLRDHAPQRRTIVCSRSWDGLRSRKHKNT